MVFFILGFYEIFSTIFIVLELLLGLVLLRIRVDCLLL